MFVIVLFVGCAHHPASTIPPQLEEISRLHNAEWSTLAPDEFSSLSRATLLPVDRNVSCEGEEYWSDSVSPSNRRWWARFDTAVQNGECLRQLSSVSVWIHADDVAEAQRLERDLQRLLDVEGAAVERPNGQRDYRWEDKRARYNLYTRILEENGRILLFAKLLHTNQSE